MRVRKRLNRNRDLCEDLTERETVIKCAEEIDLLTSEVKRYLSESKAELGDEELLRKIENMFFSSERMRKVGINELETVINSVFKRTRSRYGILDGLIEDEDVNEIMVNGPFRIFAERKRKLVEIDDAFTSEEELENMIRMFASDVHREVNEANPIVDARLPCGYRVNGVLKNVALNGPILTIRKFSEVSISMENLIAYGTVTRECSDFLSSLVAGGYNIFISGGTSSGKTTFLNALAMAIGEDERTIIIEDSSELKLDRLNNKVHMECRNANSIGKGEVNMAMLIKTSLRMRPDRIIVGEVRGKEVVDMIQAMSTGHDGSMSTGHGNSIKGMLNRLETMYIMESPIPLYSVKNQIANAIDVFVHLKREADGRRRVVEVAELVGYDGRDYVLNYLYAPDGSGRLVSTGNKLVGRGRMKGHGTAGAE